MASMTVGNLIVSVRANTDKFRKGMKRSQTALEKFRARANAVARTLTFVLAPAFAYALKQTIDFEKQMAKVSTMLDKTTRDMLPNLSDEVERMSRQWGQSTETLTNALYDILSAQIDATKATQVLEVATKAATAGFTETAVAGEAITTMLKAYKLDAKKASEMSDKLFLIIKKGRVNFEMIAPAIGQVAAVAQQAGLSLDELAAAFATLTEVGIPLDRVTTAINAIIMAMLKSTDRAKAAAAGFGLTLNSTTLRTEGLISVIQKLSQATADQVVQVFENRRAILGILPLLANQEKYYANVDAMANALGATLEALAEATSTTIHKLEKLRQELNANARALGDNLLPALNLVLSGLRKLTDWLGVAYLHNKMFFAKMAELAVDFADQFSELIEGLRQWNVFDWIPADLSKALDKSLEGLRKYNKDLMDEFGELWWGTPGPPIPGPGGLPTSPAGATGRAYGKYPELRPVGMESFTEAVNRMRITFEAVVRGGAKPGMPMPFQFAAGPRALEVGTQAAYQAREGAWRRNRERWQNKMLAETKQIRVNTEEMFDKEDDDEVMDF